MEHLRHNNNYNSITVEVGDMGCYIRRMNGNGKRYVTDVVDISQLCISKFENMTLTYENGIWNCRA